MNKTFYGHTLKIDGLLNLDRTDTHIHNIKAKRCKVNNDSATYVWHSRLGHVGDITTRCEPAYLGRVNFISSIKVIKQMKSQGL